MSVIEALINISRPARPATWTNTLTPLAKRAEVAQLKHLAQRAEHAPLADQLAQIDVVKLTSRVTEDALPHVGKLVALGKELRETLDASFNDARDAVRTATTATQEMFFKSAVEQAERYLPLAEKSVERIDAVVAEIGVVIAKIEALPYESESYVIPKKDWLGFLIEQVKR